MVAEHPLAVGVGQIVSKPEHTAGMVAAARRHNQALQMRLESYPSLPPGPVVDRRNLAVYDTLLEERT